MSHALDTESRPQARHARGLLNRRTLAAGAAWSVPTVLVSAPAAMAVCSSANWDANFSLQITCTSRNCTVSLRICSTTLCTGAVPIGTPYTVTMTNNSTTSDTMTKATGTGAYAIISKSAGAPAEGASGTLAAGATWTYNLQTAQAFPNGTCIQFQFNQMDPGKNYTFTWSLGVSDGNNANNTFTWTGNLATITTVYS